MKTTTTLWVTALTMSAASIASGQDFIAGLDFKDASNDFSSNTVFDNGPTGNNESSSFILNTQTNADDNVVIFTSAEDPGWSADNDTWTQGGSTASAGSAGVPVTVEQSSAGGAAPSTSVFGNTSADAQGFSDEFAVSFRENTDGFFTIGVGPSSLGGGFDNVLMNFDVAALASESQTTGDLLVDGNNVGVTGGFTNQTVNLGNLAAGDFITFDLTDLNNGATFDNFMIAGTAVPEPGTYAAILGALALGFAVVRRYRRS